MLLSGSLHNLFRGCPLASLVMSIIFLSLTTSFASLRSRHDHKKYRHASAWHISRPRWPHRHFRFQLRTGDCHCGTHCRHIDSHRKVALNRAFSACSSSDQIVAAASLHDGAPLALNRDLAAASPSELGQEDLIEYNTLRSAQYPSRRSRRSRQPCSFRG